MIEQEKILKIGKFDIDVSNVSVKRKRIAVRKWNILFNIKTNADGEALLDENGNTQERIKGRKITNKQADKELLKIGLYLIRQDFKVLNNRYSLSDTIKQIILRQRITLRYIDSLTVDEMNIFVDWIYKTMVGTKKKVVDLITPMIEQLEEMTKNMTTEEVSNLVTLSMTLFSEQVGRYQKLNNTPKAN